MKARGTMGAATQQEVNANNHCPHRPLDSRPGEQPYKVGADELIREAGTSTERAREEAKKIKK